MVEASRVITGGLVASGVWFVIGGVLYMNPFVARIYRARETSPGVKKWDSPGLYLVFQFLGVLAQCMLWAFVYGLIKVALPGGPLLRGFFFGLILVAVKIFPRFFDMWIQSTYPQALLAVEFINGTIGSFVVGLVFGYLI